MSGPKRPPHNHPADSICLYIGCPRGAWDAARAAAPPVEVQDFMARTDYEWTPSPVREAGLRAAIMALPIYPDLDGDRAPSVSLAAVLRLIDEAGL